MSPETLPKPWQDEDTLVLDQPNDITEYDLMVFNDEVNSFDWVIETLVNVCEHSPEQAEQCTFIIHYKGKCSVKKGSFEHLASMRNAICQRGISAEIF